jgi:hypothetical protein
MNNTRTKIMVTKPETRNDLRKIRPEIFYSVEFMIEGLPYLFQFKIWDTPQGTIFILVKESSDILSRLQEGDIIKMKYYSSVLDYYMELDTEIESISLKDQGRFRGHYAIGLNILPDRIS